jgi:molybdate transport system substrate-binding protein
LMQKLELTADIKTKTKLFPSGTEVAEAVAKGDTEIDIGVASDAAIVPGLDASPLPAGAQSYSVYVAGVGADSKEMEGSKALLIFLTSPAVKQKLSAGGFEVR